MPFKPLEGGDRGIQTRDVTQENIEALIEENGLDPSDYITVPDSSLTRFRGEMNKNIKQFSEDLSVDEVEYLFQGEFWRRCRDKLNFNFSRFFEGGLPTEGLIALFKDGVDTIGELSVFKSSVPSNAHATMQQVKASGFAGAGSATVTGLLTTDVITSSGIAPTCTVNGTLTINGDCWDVYVHRAGELWAYWPAINIGETTELDASGNGNHLTGLTTTTITERTDGTGSDYCNESGFSERENLVQYSDDLTESSVWRALNDASIDSVDTVSFTANTQGNLLLQSQKYIQANDGDIVRFAMRANASSAADRTIILRIQETASPWESVYGNYYYLQGETPVFVEATYIDGVPLSPQVMGNGAGSIVLSDISVQIVESPTRTLFSVGDSTTAEAVDEGPVNVYEAAYTYVFANTVGCAVKNSAVGGYTLSEINTAYDNNLPATAGVFFVSGGINDLLSASSDPTASMQSEATLLIDKPVSVANSVVVVFSIPDIGLSTEEDAWRATHNAWRKSYAESNGCIYADLDLVLSDDNGQISEYYTSGDLIHYNTLGHKAVAEYLTTIIDMPEDALLFDDHIATTDQPIAGRQPAGFQDFTDYQGPLRRDLIQVSGADIADSVVTAPLGAMFRSIPECQANMDLSTLVSTDNTFIGNKVAIYNPAPDAEAAIKAQEYVDR